MMDSGRDPGEGIFHLLGLIVSWLLAVTMSIKTKGYMCGNLSYKELYIAFSQ